MAKDRWSAFGLPQLPAKDRTIHPIRFNWYDSLSIGGRRIVIIICNRFVLKYRWLYYYVLMVIYSSKLFKGLISYIFQLKGEKVMTKEQLIQDAMEVFNVTRDKIIVFDTPLTKHVELFVDGQPKGIFKLV